MNKEKSRRYLMLTAVFLIACIIFVARLINFQIIYRDKYAPADSSANVERIYIHAVRGSICDRNGKVLVRDTSTYRFVLDYATMPDTRTELNRVLLLAADALDKAAEGSTYAETLIPFKGTYPDFEFSDDFTSNLEKYNEFIRLIEKNYVTDDYTLEMAKAELNATSVARYYARKYNIVKEIPTSDGSFSYESEFTDEEITRLINIRYEMDRTGFGGNKNFVFLTDATYDFNVYIRELAVDGLIIEEDVKREYLYPGYASHILGLTGKIYAEDWQEYKDKGYDINATVGISGCEAAFEEYLRGSDGIIDVYRDKNGKVIKTEVIREPIAGKDVWLTIDIDVQVAAEDSLKANIEDISSSSAGNLTGEDASSGAVTAIDPRTGELLALASYPTYDLSTYREDVAELLKDPRSPLLNRALQTTLAPGSTFKVGMAMAALESGIYSPSWTMTCHGYYDRYGYTNAFKCAVHPMGFGTVLNVSEAIRISCNCFFYETGHMLGIDEMNAWCKLYGFGLSTGIELSENTGILAGREYREAHPEFCLQNGLEAWKGGDTWQAAIGQSENAFTPLQVGNYISTVINGGDRYSAHLLHSVRTYDGKIVLENEPTVLSSANLSASNVELIKTAMNKVVTTDRGTISRAFRDVEYTVGAKTGTAQAGKNASNNAWFVAFAPVDNPEIVVTTMIERGYSGSYASHTARGVMDAYFGK
jgi:penicillin-binding protein 2